jgi:pimeloyl-ACP methyl ester carboxylesterase
MVSWITQGTCDALSKITQPTLVIVGTDDIWTPAVSILQYSRWRCILGSEERIIKEIAELSEVREVISILEMKSS